MRTIKYLEKRMQKRVLSFLILIVVSFTSPLFAEVNKNSDFQFWNEQSIKIPLSAKWEIKGISEFRYGNNASFFFAKYYQGQLIYKMLMWLSLSPGYRQMWVRSKESPQWTPLYMPFFEAVLHGNLASWEVSNRTRATYIMVESKEKTWSFRNRLMLVSPFRVTKLCIAPYISEEVFFLQKDGFFQSRFIAGLTTRYSRNFTSKVYYMLRSDKIIGLLGSSKKRGDWRHQNVAGVCFDFSF